MRVDLRLLIGLWSLGALTAGAALAHEEQLPIGGKKLLVKTASAARQKFLFKAVDQAEIAPRHDPAVDGAWLLVRGTGANAGRSGLIALDPTKWKGLGRPAGSKGYLYTDSDASQGGVKKVKLTAGKLLITAGGPAWPWSVSGPQDQVWVHFRVGEESYCAAFGGDMKSNEAGKVSAKDADAPPECPTPLCGNGIVELGEACDDGNLIDTDSCTSLCASGSCGGGQSFPSTWEAIQTVIFQNGGCNTVLCHTGQAPAGNLLLDPAVAHGNLVNVVSTASTLDRVEPGEEDLSFLYQKLAAATRPDLYPPQSIGGSPMPAGGLPPISTDALEALRLWIRAGAPTTGTVEGTAELLDSCLPPVTPQKIPPLAPPALGTGVQIYQPPWALPANSETEGCFATYYDLTQIPGAVPAANQVPCPDAMGGSGETCFTYHDSELAQDPQSHHSIIHVYRGTYAVDHASWGTWACRGGTHAGTPCDPTQIGVSATQGGADCGPRSACATSFQPTIACIGFGPPDYGFNVSGNGTPAAPRIGGAQQPLLRTTFADGAYNTLPMKAVVVWNHHAFNTTSTDTTMEQYYNLNFASAANQVYQVASIFDSSDIFIQNVPAFESREYCRTYTAPLNSHIFELSSHTHKRGVLFRIWDPPNAACSSSSGSCLPNAGAPRYTSTDYSDPLQLRIDPPMFLNSTTAANRRFKFCGVYDNGETDPAAVKRASTSPEPALPFAPGGPCATSELRCFGGTHHNELCNGDHAVCDTTAGLGDGVCDACPLRGGVTTEDEMFIMLGLYYIAP